MKQKKKKMKEGEWKIFHYCDFIICILIQSTQATSGK